MSSFYFPPTGGGGGIPIYATFSAFPSGVNIGDLAVAADSGIIYEWRGSSWVAIAAPGDVLSIGVFGSTPNADGLSITTNVLQMQPASASFPGGVSTSAQTFAGTKSFGTILASTDNAGAIGATASRFANGYFSTSLSVGTYPLSAGNGYAVLLDGSFPQVQLYAGGSNVYAMITDGTYMGFENTGTGTLFAKFTDTSFTLTDGTHNYLAGSSSGVTSFGPLAASNLSGTNTGDVTLGTANGLSLSAQVLSLGLSSTSTTGALSSTDWTTFNGKQASGSYITALTGDGTASGPGSSALTLATVNANVGSFGSSTAIPSFTVNGKGLITAASTSVVIAPAGTLTGTTLASNVVTSSLTTVGTIGTGVWQGTAVAATYGGTGISTAASTGYPSILSGTWSVASTANTFITLWKTVATTGGDLIYGGATGTPTRLANGSAGQFLMSNGTTLAPSWAAPTITLTAPKFTVYSSGSGNFTTSNNCLYIIAELVGPGGGGAGSGTAGAGAGGAGSANTTFGTLVGGLGAGGAAAGAGGSGGSASLGAGSWTAIKLQIGGTGGAAQISQIINAAQVGGGAGGSTPYGFAASNGASPGLNAPANSGGGGSGGGSQATGALDYSGGGGAGGGFVKATIVPTANQVFAYSVGTGGGAGTAGTNGQAGGAGADGYIVITEYYQ